jgi:WD40 repeat protein
MDHPNIARVLDGGMTVDRRPYFVMELVNGLPLTKFCDDAKLGIRERLELFQAICQAVQHAHQKGIIHRDLKPSNILVTLIDARPMPKVIDFGVAKAVGGKLLDESLSTHFGAVVGTLEYMAPEQAGYSGTDIDTRADIYSLGVVLYELLTGLRPIDGKRLRKAALAEMIRIIQEEEPSKPSTRLSTDEALPSLAALRQTEPRKLMALLRGELDWVVMKCLEKQRDRRYETASGLAQDLQRYLADEPVEARPPTARYRLGKFLRRHTGAAVAAGCVAGALLLGTGLAIWQAVLARRAEQNAVEHAQAAETAREDEAAARGQADRAREQTESALHASQVLTARMAYERGQHFCEQGQADVGLLWMARSLELTPRPDADLDRAIRTSMNLWARRLGTVRLTAPMLHEKEYVEHASASPDGLSLATIVADGSVRLWEWSTGKLRRKLPLEADAPQPGDRWLRQVAFSPDGRFLAASRAERRARVWNVVSGQPVKNPLDHDDPVLGLGFHPGGMILATSAGKMIRFWSVERGVPEGEPLTLDREALGVGFSSDGRRLLAWSRDRVLIWEMPSRKLLQSLSGLDFAINNAAFSPDGRFALVNGVQDGQFWDLSTSKLVGARMHWTNQNGPGGAHRSSFRADGKVVVTGGYPPRLWETPSGKPLGSINSALEAYCPVLNPDGKSLLANQVFVEMPPGLEPSQQIGQEDGFFAAVAGPGGKTVVTVHWGEGRHVYRLFDLTTGRAIGPPIEMEGPPSRPIPPAFSQDGRSVAIGAGTKSCQLWDTATGREHGPRITLGSAARALALSPDGQVLASANTESEVRLWNPLTGKPIGGPFANPPDATNLLCFSPDGRKLLATGWRGEARVWEARNGQPLGPALKTLWEINDSAMSPDGQSIVTASFELARWDPVAGKRLWVAPTADAALQVAFSPDGRQVLARFISGDTARLYDARTGAPTAQLKHYSMVIESSFSPDGKLVRTCSSDLTARLWDAATGLPVGPVWANEKTEPRGCFTGDGRGVLISDDARHISLWEIPPPLEGTPERIRASVEAATRHTLDENGWIRPLIPMILPEESVRAKHVVLGPDPFEPVRKRLEELGGPPGCLRR